MKGFKKSQRIKTPKKSGKEIGTKEAPQLLFLINLLWLCLDFDFGN